MHTPFHPAAGSIPAFAVSDCKPGSQPGDAMVGQGAFQQPPAGSTPARTGTSDPGDGGCLIRLWCNWKHAQARRQGKCRIVPDQPAFFSPTGEVLQQQQQTRPLCGHKQKPSRNEEPMSDPIVIDNIDLDLTSVDLSRPLLPKQTLRCRTGEVKVLEEDGKRRLVVPLTLEEPGKDTRGSTVNVGFQVTDSILLTPTGGLTQQMINERVARFVAACDKTDRAGSNSFRPADYAGKEVLVTFDVRVDKQDSTKTYQDCKRYAAVR